MFLPIKSYGVLSLSNPEPLCLGNKNPSRVFHPFLPPPGFSAPFCSSSGRGGEGFTLDLGILLLDLESESFPSPPIISHPPPSHQAPAGSRHSSSIVSTTWSSVLHGRVVVASLRLWSWFRSSWSPLALSETGLWLLGWFVMLWSYFLIFLVFFV